MSLKTVSFKCPNCNAQVTFPEDVTKVECEYCGGEITLQEELDHVQSANAAGIKEYTDRAYDLIRQEEFNQAAKIAKEGLVAFPYAGRLHLVLLMSELNITKPSMLGSYGKDYSNSINFQNCLRYMDSTDKKDLLSLAESNGTNPGKGGVYDQEKAPVIDRPASTVGNGPFTAMFLDGCRQKRSDFVNLDMITKYSIDLETCGAAYEKAMEDMKPILDEIQDYATFNSKAQELANKFAEIYVNNLRAVAPPNGFPAKEENKTFREGELTDEIKLFLLEYGDYFRDPSILEKYGANNDDLAKNIFDDSLYDMNDMLDKITNYETLKKETPNIVARFGEIYRSKLEKYRNTGDYRDKKPFSYIELD